AVKRSRAESSAPGQELWPKEEWVSILAPFLTPAVAAQEFYKWGFNAQSPPRPQMTQLTRLAKRWLQPEHCSPEQVLEKVVTHHFLQTLPPELQKAVGLKEPATTKTMIEATEAAQTVLARDGSRGASPQVGSGA
uniref:SCAN box domain-containing protein n=1 Tax=Astyanax mexicanus TaxID=7994 RepID=A0A8B9J4Q1_ASTMX